MRPPQMAVSACFPKKSRQGFLDPALILPKSWPRFLPYSLGDLGGSLPITLVPIRQCSVAAPPRLARSPE
jgi:hypothetical protein